MKAYAIALAAGLLVGAIYGLLNVRSPAPPVIALVGLMGILIGEQVPPVLRHMFAGKALASAMQDVDCATHILGPLPANATCPADLHPPKGRAP